MHAYHLPSGTGQDCIPHASPHCAHCLQAVDKASFLPSGAASATRGGGGGSHQQQANLVDTLAALRCAAPAALCCAVHAALYSRCCCTCTCRAATPQLSSVPLSACTAPWYADCCCLPCSCNVCPAPPCVCRELGHMYAPLSLVAMPELKECLGRLKAHAVRLPALFHAPPGLVLRGARVPWLCVRFQLLVLRWSQWCSSPGLLERQARWY